MADPIRTFVITEHAALRIAQRGIDLATLERVVREVLERQAVKVTYDARTDTLTMILREDARIAESDEGRPGVVLDFDDEGNLVSLEILDASRRVSDTRKVEFQMTE